MEKIVWGTIHVYTNICALFQNGVFIPDVSRLTLHIGAICAFYESQPQTLFSISFGSVITQENVYIPFPPKYYSCACLWCCLILVHL